MTSLKTLKEKAMVFHGLSQYHLTMEHISSCSREEATNVFASTGGESSVSRELTVSTQLTFRHLLSAMGVRGVSHQGWVSLCTVTQQFNKIKDDFIMGYG